MCFAWHYLWYQWTVDVTKHLWMQVESCAFGGWKPESAAFWYQSSSSTMSDRYARRPRFPKRALENSGFCFVFASAAAVAVVAATAAVAAAATVVAVVVLGCVFLLNTSLQVRPYQIDKPETLDFRNRASNLFWCRSIFNFGFLDVVAYSKLDFWFHGILEGWICALGLAGLVSGRIGIPSVDLLCGLGLLGLFGFCWFDLVHAASVNQFAFLNCHRRETHMPRPSISSLTTFRKWLPRIDILIQVCFECLQVSPDPPRAFTITVCFAMSSPAASAPAQAAAAPDVTCEICQPLVVGEPITPWKLTSSIWVWRMFKGFLKIV